AKAERTDVEASDEVASHARVLIVEDMRAEVGESAEAAAKLAEGGPVTSEPQDRDAATDQRPDRGQAATGRGGGS
ncbi:MAG TPA: hypothetical protein VEY67_09650, partial [Candidatus Dormibacteraeota bacterium]|nr:hypothetical protein [Candidatus Dormibacteraeota bacterium]